MTARRFQNDPPIFDVVKTGWSLERRLQMHLLETGLDFSVQARLFGAGIRLVGDLEGKNMRDIRGIGLRSIALINCALASIGLKLTRTNGGVLVEINDA